MATIKSLFSAGSLAAFLVLLVALATHTQMARSQTCSTELSALNSCAAFVVPGAPNANPSAECCHALQGVDQSCLCNTLRIASRLPAQCGFPQMNCAA